MLRECSAPTLALSAGACLRSHAAAHVRAVPLCLGTLVTPESSALPQKGHAGCVHAEFWVQSPS